MKDRPGDIALLVSRFLKEFAAENGGRVKGIDAPALKMLEDYSWPGNVRQLRNVIEKMVVLAMGEKLTVDDVPMEVRTTTTPAPTKSAAEPTSSGTLEDIEKARILATIESCKGNKSKAAEILGISRRTLHRKLNAWKIN